LPEREKRAAEYAGSAVALLGRAAEAGFFTAAGVQQLDRDRDLAALRDLPDFRALRAGLSRAK
jgi:hypothetical protein